MVKSSLEEVVAVKRIGLLASLVTVVVLLAIPSSAIAGWAGSRYERSDCTPLVGDGGRPGLYCETLFIGPQEEQSFVVSVADSRCPSGFREIQQLKTFEVTYLGYGYFNGPVPLPKFETLGNEFPVSYRLISTVDIDLGCAP
jgi:hypothetical protein